MLDRLPSELYGVLQNMLWAELAAGAAQLEHPQRLLSPWKKYRNC